jgi:hypothetical protein
MVHPNPFIDDEAEEDPDYVDSSDEREEEVEEDEIDYYVYRTEHNSALIQDSTISSTENSPLSPYVNRSSSPTWNQYSPGRASSASLPLYEPHTPESSLCKHTYVRNYIQIFFHSLLCSCSKYYRRLLPLNLLLLSL